MPNHDLKQGQTRRGTAIQTEEDRKSLSLAEMLADPNYELGADEAFDAVNFISEEYNPINKDNISIKIVSKEEAIKIVSDKNNNLLANSLIF